VSHQHHSLCYRVTGSLQPGTTVLHDAAHGSTILVLQYLREQARNAGQEAK